MSLSLMNAQMMRVISSPSSSTTGFCTLIFAIGGRGYLCLGGGLDPCERGGAPLVELLRPERRRDERAEHGDRVHLRPRLGDVGAVARRDERVAPARRRLVGLPRGEGELL